MTGTPSVEVGPIKIDLNEGPLADELFELVMNDSNVVLDGNQVKAPVTTRVAQLLEEILVAEIEALITPETTGHSVSVRRE